MAGDDDSIRSRDSADLISPPEKKPKIETDTEARKHPPTSFVFNGRVIRRGKSDDPEYVRQRDLFYQQFSDSEGFDVDWDKFDYSFTVINFEWNPDLDDELSNKEVLELLVQSAIEEHDDDHGTKLKYMNYVSANIISCKGLLYHITFWASDLNSSDQEPKLYQAKVQRYCDDITVVWVRLKPTQ